MSDLTVQIHEFVPTAAGEELEHRIALYKARDHAAMLCGKVTCTVALNHACDAHEAAGEHVFADLPADRLKTAVTYVRSLVQAAFIAEQFYGEAPEQ